MSKLPLVVIFRFLIGLILVPLLIIIFENFNPLKLNFDQSFDAIQFTFLISFTSAFLATALALILSLLISPVLKNPKLYFVMLLIFSSLPIIFIVFGFRVFFNSLGIIEYFYSPIGLIIVYLYFNISLSTATLGYYQLTNPYKKIALILDLKYSEYFFKILFPALKTPILFTFLITFILSFQDFNIVYLMSLKPKYTTASLYTFQQLLFNGDLNALSFLSLIQIVLVLILIPFILRINLVKNFELNLLKKKHNLFYRIFAETIALCFILMLLLPIFFGFLPLFGLNKNDIVLFLQRPIFLEALTNSVIISFSIAICAGLIAYCHILISLKNIKKIGHASAFSFFMLMLPQLAISVGIYLVFARLNLIEITNSKLFFIFLGSILISPLLSIYWQTPIVNARHSYDHLIKNFNLSIWQTIKYIDLPAIYHLLVASLFVAFFYNLQDLTIVSSFQTPFITIASLYKIFMVSYGFKEASILQLIVFLIIFLAIVLISLQYARNAYFKRS